MPGWHRHGAVDPRSLVDARLQSHWAAQLAATVGRTLLPPHGDDSHTAFRWDASHEALVQGPIRDRRSAFRIADLWLMFLEGGHVAAELPLDGRTMRDAFVWIETQAPGVREVFNDPMPPHPVRHGAKFSLGDGRAFAELSRYYANADLVLGALDDVRCWPHHFDIATLLEFEHGSKTVGVGLSPGDDGCPEPYYYVNHYPVTSRKELPPLAGGGTWNTKGWTGAILPASRFAGADDQQSQVEEFLRSGVAASRSLIGA
ncbi:MAG: hypothetical protein ACXVIJ_12660 [Thermoanaerobaculia bacterium]